MIPETLEKFLRTEPSPLVQQKFNGLAFGPTFGSLLARRNRAIRVCLAADLTPTFLTEERPLL
jgi:hypothetical protein